MKQQRVRGGMTYSVGDAVANFSLFIFSNTPKNNINAHFMLSGSAKEPPLHHQ